MVEVQIKHVIESLRAQFAIRKFLGMFGMKYYSSQEPT